MEAAQQAPAAGGSKLLPIVVGVLVLANFGGMAFMMLRANKPAAPAAESHAHQEAAPSTGPTVQLDTFVVNLNEPGSTRYLKTTFEIEVRDAHVATDLTNLKRVVRDELLTYLSSLTVPQTLGDTAKAKIREEMVERTDKILGGGKKVLHVFFTEFVVQ